MQIKLFSDAQPMNAADCASGVRFAPPPSQPLIHITLGSMKTLEQVLESVARADVFLGATVDSVHTERLSGETPLHVCAKWRR